MILRPSWRTVGAAATILVSSIGWAATASAATYTFRVELGEACLSGKGPANANLQVTLKKGDGTVLEHTHANTDAQGAWEGCFLGGDTVRTGRRLTATDGSTSRTWQVPRLTLSADRGDDTIQGTGPANGSVRVRVFDCNTDMVACPVLAVSTRVRTNDRGRYAIDISRVFDALGRDPIEVTRTSSAGDRTTRRGSFPWFGVTPGQGQVRGRVGAGQETRVTLRESPGGTSLFSALVQGDANGRFDVSTLPAPIAAGNHVKAAFERDARMTVPGTFMYVQSGSHIVNVTCLPNRPVHVYWEGGQYAFVEVADDDGKISVDVDDRGLSVPSSTEFRVECPTGAGDLVELRYSYTSS